MHRNEVNPRVWRVIIAGLSESASRQVRVLDAASLAASWHIGCVHESVLTQKHSIIIVAELLASSQRLLSYKWRCIVDWWRFVGHHRRVISACCNRLATYRCHSATTVRCMPGTFSHRILCVMTLPCVDVDRRLDVTTSTLSPRPPSSSVYCRHHHAPPASRAARTIGRPSRYSTTASVQCPQAQMPERTRPTSPTPQPSPHSHRSARTASLQRLAASLFIIFFPNLSRYAFIICTYITVYVSL